MLLSPVTGIVAEVTGEFDGIVTLTVALAVFALSMLAVTPDRL